MKQDNQANIVICISFLELLVTLSGLLKQHKDLQELKSEVISLPPQHLMEIQCPSNPLVSGVGF